tara:strand:+ start:430 stop:810 length:381 start_codon:yes stop_codon:yes gene_type:complete
MKSITIAGNVGRDAVMRDAGDSRVMSFPIAVSDGFGDKKRTIWFDCSMWGNRGDKLSQYITKGSQVCVSGDLSTREHDGKTYLTVRVNELTLMGGKQSDANGDERPARQTAERQSYTNDIDDEIPF